MSGPDLPNKIMAQFWRDFVALPPNAPRIWRAKTALDLAPPPTLCGEESSQPWRLQRLSNPFLTGNWDPSQGHSCGLFMVRKYNYGPCTLRGINHRQVSASERIL